MSSGVRILFVGLAMAATVLAAESVRAATYYVSTASNASNNNTGTEASPWRKISYAASKAVAGDTVYIKAGNYENEYVNVRNSGTSSKPIVFEGYGGTVQLGKLPSPRTTPANTEIGFKISGKNYITLRNLNFTWYYECVYVSSSDYVTLENLRIEKCGGEGAYGDGIVFTWSDYGKIIDCTVIDCGGNNVFFNQSKYCVVDNLKTFGTLANTDTYATDYYFAMRCSSNNTIKNSHAEDQTNTTKGNHGFIIKDLSYTPNSTGNVIQDCTAKNFEECFSVAHKAYGNTFIRCTADNSKRTSGYNTCFQTRNGAHDNTFRECTGTIGRGILASLSNYNEGNNSLNKANNKWINCTLRGTGLSSSIGIYFDRTSGTSFENCVFDNVYYLARYTNTNTGNSFKNSILTRMTARYDSRNLAYPYGGMAGTDGTSALTATYNDFFGNSFASFGGEGTISLDPKFTDQAGGDYHLKSTAGRWNGQEWVQDGESSPCIDAGDKASVYTLEPAPNGARINIGRYGNTGEASKSPDGGNGGYVDQDPYDNRMIDGTATTVYATNSYLDIGHSTSSNRKCRALIWFDLGKYDRPVKNATLSLYWYFPSAVRTSDTLVQIYRPAMGWDHNTVCWTNKANGAAWTNPGGDWYDKTGKAQGTTSYASVTFNKSQLPTNSFYSFDVTALVNEYIASGQNAGFFVKARYETNNYIAFYGLSATDSATRPKLTVTPGDNAVHTWAVYD